MKIYNVSLTWAFPAEDEAHAMQQIIDKIGRENLPSNGAEIWEDEPDEELD